MRPFTSGNLSKHKREAKILARYFTVIAFAVVLAFTASANFAAAQSKKAAQPTYYGIDLNPAKADPEARAIGLRQLRSEEDGGIILGQTQETMVGARFLDKGKILLALQINDDCRPIGCRTFIYMQTDKKKNTWVRALDTMAFSLWTVVDGSKKFKVAVQSLANEPATFFYLDRYEFVYSAAPTTKAKP